MGRECDNRKCSAQHTSRWGLLAQKAKQFKLGEATYCSRECFSVGLCDLLRREIDRTREEKASLNKNKIGAILINEGLLSKEQLDMALKFQRWSPGKRIGECLTELGFLNRAQINRWISHQEKIPFLNIDTIELDENVVHMIPLCIGRRIHILPYKYTIFNREVSLACLPPVDRSIMTLITRMLGYDTAFYLVQRSLMERLVEAFEANQNDTDIMVNERLDVNGALAAQQLTERLMNDLPPEANTTTSIAIIRDNLWIRIVTGEKYRNVIYSLLPREE